MKLNVVINGTPRAFEVQPDTLLLDLLRDAGYLGVKYGCRKGNCGTCTVLVDGRAILSCVTLAGQVAGRHIETIEGVGSVDKPHPIQRAMVAEGAVQCGFCTPGMVLSTKALLANNPHPAPDEIRRALDGNLCRCTGYEKIVRGVQRAANEKGGDA